MDVLVAGAHGQIARRMNRLLVAAGHTVRGIIRDPDHVADLAADGVSPVLCDLEHEDVGPFAGGADAIVFAAGAGPGSGDARKRTLDLGGAVKCLDAATAAGVARFVIVSSMGPEAGKDPGSMGPYYEAKAEADDAVRASGLDWTIVRPGRLTDDPGTGRVDAAGSLDRRGEIPRDDVAAVLVAVLSGHSTVGVGFDLLAGDTPVDDAVAALAGS